MTREKIQKKKCLNKTKIQLFVRALQNWILIVENFVETCELLCLKHNKSVDTIDMWWRRLTVTQLRYHLWVKILSNLRIVSNPFYPKVSYLPSGSFIIRISFDCFPNRIGKLKIEVKCHEINATYFPSNKWDYKNDNVHTKLLSEWCPPSHFYCINWIRSRQPIFPNYQSSGGWFFIVNF